MTKGIYLQLLMDNKDKTSESIDQINKDIERTFPGQVFTVW